MNAQNFKNLCPEVFDYCKILEMREQILLNPRPFLLLLLRRWARNALKA